MKTIIEVGANNGRDTERFVMDKDSMVYAFEPTPVLFRDLSSKFKGAENIRLVPMAVDIESKFKWFNIAGTGDWGCSSLHEFADNIHEKWPGRPDFKFTDRLQVMTIRLDTFMGLYGIEEIDYLWIDAQGNDFNVLKSLGSEIDKVKEGRCEVAYNVELYKETENTTETVVAWLKERGFKCTVNPDGPGQWEADIHFMRV
jgi:hypothetical protein